MKLISVFQLIALLSCTLICASQIQEMTLIESGLRLLQERSDADGIFILGNGATVNSVLVNGVETLANRVNDNSVFFIETKSSLGSLIEVTSTAVNGASNPSILVVVKYVNEDGIKEYSVSGDDWLCNEYPSKKVNLRNLSDIAKINRNGFFIWNDFGVATSTCAVAIRNRRKSRLVRLTAFANDKLIDFKVGQSVYRFKDDSVLRINYADLIVNNGINNGDIIGFTATDLGITPGIGIRAKVEFEDNFFQKRIYLTNTNEWKCNDQPAVAVFDGLITSELGSQLGESEKIWKREPQGSVFCYFIYREYKEPMIQINVSVRATRLLELNIGSYSYIPPVGVENNRLFNLSPLVNLNDGDLILVKVSAEVQSYTAVALQMSFRDSNGKFRTISTNNKDWICNGNREPRIDPNPGKVGEGVFIFSDTGLKFRICHTVYRSSLSSNY